MNRNRAARPFVTLILLLAAGVAGAADSDWAPLFGLRVRQEYLPNVYYFDPVEQDRNWVRYRTRGGLRWRPAAGHTFQIRLVNEFRKIYEPDTKVDWSEIVIDRLSWRWRTGGERPVTITAGRQEIIWEDGFLMLEGHPFDGSRSMYQTAIRGIVEGERGAWDLSLIANEKRDPIALVADKKFALSDGNERAVAIRYFTPGGRQAGLIVKSEKDPDRARPDFTSWTLDLRQAGETRNGVRHIAELATQHRSAGGESGFAYAARLEAGRELAEKTSGAVGCWYYSGDGGRTEAFRTPYGRWPMWSDMWVYSMVGEGGVAEWQNLLLPYAEFERALHRGADLRATLFVPYAQEPEWEDRGLLATILVRLRLAPRLSGHLLWEWHVTGAYPEETSENAHFLRWQLNYDFE